MASSEQEFLNVIEAQQGRIRRICRNYSDDRDTEEDLFQEVMLNLWKSFDSFRGEASRATWVYRVTLYTCMSVFRNKKKQQEADYQYAGSADSEPHDNEERIGRLHAALRQLNEIDRAVVILFLEERTYEEIGSIVGMSQSNVGARLHRAKQKIKRIMEGHGDG